MNNNNTKKAKILSGIVVSDKMADTVVVLVERYEKHSKYDKFIKSRKRFKAHVTGKKPLLGERVSIAETRPISKDKHFRLVQN